MTNACNLRKCLFASPHALPLPHPPSLCLPLCLVSCLVNCLKRICTALTCVVVLVRLLLPAISCCSKSHEVSAASAAATHATHTRHHSQRATFAALMTAFVQQNGNCSKYGLQMLPASRRPAAHRLSPLPSPGLLACSSKWQ